MRHSKILDIPSSVLLDACVRACSGLCADRVIRSRVVVQPRHFHVHDGSYVTTVSEINALWLVGIGKATRTGEGYLCAYVKIR